MFTSQLILAVIISSAKIVFADILVQPGYEHQRSTYPQYQPVLHYKVPTAAKHYAKQLPAQHLNQYIPQVQIVQPYYVPGVYQNKVRSSLVGYPHHSLLHYPYNHYMTKKPTSKLHYIKLGGHEYVRPSVFIAHPNPLIAHYRRKRSTDFTNVKSTEPAIATHDVAPKPSLIDIEYPTAIDSLLLKNESTSTNDKHVKNRQSDFTTKPFLFGLDPNKMYSRFRNKNLDERENETEHLVSKRQDATVITPVILTQFTPDSTKTTVTEPSQQAVLISQEKGKNQEPSRTNYENTNLTPNVPSTNWEQSSSPITTSQIQSPQEESREDYIKYYTNYGNTYAYTLPMTSIAYQPTIPFASKYWPNYITYNANMYPSKRTKYLDQQNTSNYPIIHQTSDQKSSQETTNIGATNTAQPKQELFTPIHLCAGGVPCSTSNIEIKKPPTEAIPSTPTTTPASYYTFTQYRNNEVPSKSEIISAPYSGTSQAFYTIPNDYTYMYYYLNDYLKDNLDNSVIDYQDYDYNDKPTYLTDGFNIYMTKNPAYSSNVPSYKIPRNMFYGNINARSNVAPITYVVSTSSNVPQMQLSSAYYYPKRARKAYAFYDPQRNNDYKNYKIRPNFAKPRVFWRMIPSQVYYSSPVYS
ncbi:uncharacterized protein LOC115240323 [Formica exsecta]|uniref:uncharacterized protein LOC115240323 n=1 Tax=Formica exsecta TaxID=72781 RepID=UPI001143CCB9|nr:uncharacterized protein LOC115240323 [Formica exsecta]